MSEDVRELARALRGELRSAQWEAKRAARDARREWRAYYHSNGWHDHSRGHGGWYPPAGTGGQGAPPGPTEPGVVDPGDEGGAPGAAGAAGGPGSPGAAWGEWLGRLIPPPPPIPPRPSYGPRNSRDQRRQRYASYPPQPAPPPPPPVPPKPQRVRASQPPIRHRKDGSTLLSLLLVLAGLAWLASASGVFNVSLEAVLATVLAIIGAAMVLTARTDWGLSRKSWPAWLGAGLLAVLLVSANGSVISNSISSLHFGPVTTSPKSTDPISDFAGPIKLNLGNLATPTSPASLVVRDTFGPVGIVVPTWAGAPHVIVDAHTVFGPVNLPTGSGSSTYDNGGKGPAITVKVNDIFGPINVTSDQSEPS